MRSSRSSGAGKAFVTSLYVGLLERFPTLSEIRHQRDESRIGAETVQPRVLGKKRVVLVPKLDRVLHPCDGFISHSLHGIEGREPERNIVICAGRFFNPRRDET